MTEKGMQQAREAGKRLKDEKIDYIFSSPFIRCLKTASLVVGELKQNTEQKLFVEPGFVEDLSITQFPPGCLKAKDLHNDFPGVDPEYDNFLKDFLPENDEYVCEKRIRQTIENILEKYPGNILIVSHGSPIAAIHKVLGNTIRDIGYCALSYFIVTKVEEAADIDNDGKNDIDAKYNFKCVFAGDMSHLSQKTEVVYPVFHPDENPQGITPAPMKAPS
uniref:Phosphoglycerate mutase n=1 Tax=Panagrolaimus sp. ES5 TaxID=591445 RepID=A0AC34FUB4_9BILA